MRSAPADATASAEPLSHHTLIHAIVRPAVRRVAPLGVTPNQITTVRLATGLLAAGLFAAGGALWPAVGAGVFLLSMLLDRADGELARQTGQMSDWGYRYDLWSDGIASAATFIGLGVGLWGVMGWAAPGLGLLAGLGIALLFFELNVLKLADVQGYSLWGGRVTVDPDDAMVFVPLLVWLGWSRPMLIAAAMVTPLAALGVWLVGRRRSP